MSYQENSQQPAAANPTADCSGDPSNCPDNEGYGCACTPVSAEKPATPSKFGSPELQAMIVQRASEPSAPAAEPNFYDLVTLGLSSLKQDYSPECLKMASTQSYVEDAVATLVRAGWRPAGSKAHELAPDYIATSELTAAKSDARYAEGYEAGWKEGREEQATTPPTPPQEAAALDVDRYRLHENSEGAYWHKEGEFVRYSDYAALAATAAQVAVPEEREHEVAVLLRLRQPLADGTPVHVIITKPRYEALKSVEELNSHDNFLYDEHTCPTNWLGVEYIIDGEDCDPHGVFEHVQTIEIPRDSSGSLIDFSDCNEYGHIDSLRELFSALAPSPAQPAPGADAAQGEALSQQAALESALDAEYPIPDSPHESVKQRAYGNRSAFERGWNAALNKQEPTA